MSAKNQRHTIPAQRRQQILTAVRSGAMHVAELAEHFGVSEMTVRRDLHALAEEGRLERVRGGAVQSTTEPPFAETVVERFGAKNRIGAAAAALVQDGQTVMIDIGTTTLQAARHLRGRKITVITTSLAVYEELVSDPDIELILPGGQVRRNYRSMVGVLAEGSLRQLRADILFLGTSAVDAELGVWDSTMVEVPIKRAMIASAERVALLADAEKFVMTSRVRVCDADAVDVLVTDADVTPGLRAVLDDAGIDLTVAAIA